MSPRALATSSRHIDREPSESDSHATAHPRTPRLKQYDKPRPSQTCTTKSPAKNEQNITNISRHSKESTGTSNWPLLSYKNAFLLSKALKENIAKHKWDYAVRLLFYNRLASDIDNWNIVLREGIQTRRFQRTFFLYNEMKKRGTKANLVTFNVLLGGYSNVVQDWSSLDVQLRNCHSIWEQFLEFMTNDYMRDKSILTTPQAVVASYLKILSSAGLYEEVFEIYHTIDPEGPMAPNVSVYMRMFFFLEDRRFPGVSRREQQQQNASDARVLWRDVMRSVNQGKVKMDASLLRRPLKLCIMGTPNDHTFALDIVRTYTTLAQPGEEELNNDDGSRIPLSSTLSASILELCNAAKKHRLCIHFANQLMNSDKTARTLADAHVRQILLAHAHLVTQGSMTESAQAREVLKWAVKEAALGTDGVELRPSTGSYNVALMVCYKARDWEGTLEIFELMTGYRAADFLDESGHDPVSQQRSPGIKRDPDAEGLAMLTRTAWQTRDIMNIRQCLRIVARYSPRKLSKTLRGKFAAWYYAQLASCVVRMISFSNSKPGTNEKEKESWNSMKKDWEISLQETVSLETLVPELEMEELGSRRGIGMMEENIDFRMASRQL